MWQAEVGECGDEGAEDAVYGGGVDVWRFINSHPVVVRFEFRNTCTGLALPMMLFSTHSTRQIGRNGTSSTPPTRPRSSILNLGYLAFQHLPRRNHTPREVRWWRSHQFEQ